MTRLLMLGLIMSLSLFANTAMQEARGLTNSRVLSAGYGNGVQKLYVITNAEALLFEKRGNSYQKFFSKKFKNKETALFRSAGLSDVDRNGSLDFWFATKTSKKKTLYVVNTRPKRGKHSLYLVALKNNGALLKSGNLRQNGTFHTWMKNRVKNLNENLTIQDDKYRKPPVQLVKPTNAMRIAQSLVDGRILKAGFYNNFNGMRFLYVVTNNMAYVFRGHGTNINSYKDFFKQAVKSGYSFVLPQIGMEDISKNTFGDFYYLAQNNAGKRVLTVVNTRPKGQAGSYHVYLVMQKPNGSLTKSGNLRQNGVYHTWMKNKLGVRAEVTQPVMDKPMLGGDHVFFCEIYTTGNGGFKAGNYCSLPVADLQTNELVFQYLNGKVNYIAAHERFSNGTWKLTYKGGLRTLRLSDVRKTNTSTHINLSVNGTHERYDRTIAKVRVYKRALRNMMPSIEEAKNILKRSVRLKRNEMILKVFLYKENSINKIAAITTRGVYILRQENPTFWRLIVKQLPKLKNVSMLNQFYGVNNVDGDDQQDVYFTTVDKRKGYKLLNVLSPRSNSLYTAYAKLGEAIGDFDPEVEFKFTPNTPKHVQPWLKRMIFKFGFVKKPRELSQTNPSDATRLWVRENGFFNKGRELQLRLRMFNGDQDRMFVSNKPVVAETISNNIVYRSHYKGAVTAYNRNTNQSYVVYVPKLKKNFVTALNASGNRIFLGTQNDGLIIFNARINTLRVLKHRGVMNQDIWNIVNKGSQYFIFTDSKKAIKVPARKMER